MSTWEEEKWRAQSKKNLQYIQQNRVKLLTPDTSAGVAAEIYRIYERNQDSGNQLMQEFRTLQVTPTSKFYNPYIAPTNSKPLQSLAELGMDTNINDDWFEKNKDLTQYYRLSVDGTPLAPTTKSGSQEIAAYAYWKLAQDEEPTKNAENELQTLKKELGYWALRTDRNYSDDEIIAKIDWSKYPTLQRLDEGKQYGKPVALNRAVGYDRESLKGAIWAARNGRESADLFEDAVSAELKRGTQYQNDPKKRSLRDPSSKNYNPYLLGSTLDEEAAFFGVSGFNQEWLDKNTGVIRAGGDPEANRLLDRVWAAEEKTEQYETALDLLVETPVSRITKQVQRIMRVDGLPFEDALKAFLEEDDELAPLADIAKSLERKSPVAVTRGVGFNYYALRDLVEQDVRMMNLRKTDPVAASEAERQAIAEKDGDAIQPETVPPSPLKDPKDPDGASMPWHVQLFKNVSTWLLDLGEHEPVSALPEGTGRIAGTGAADFSYNPITGTSTGLKQPTGLKQAPSLEETYWAKVEELKALNARLNTANETAEDLFRSDELQAELFEMEQQLKEQGKQEKVDEVEAKEQAGQLELEKYNAIEIPEGYVSENDTALNKFYQGRLKRSEYLASLTDEERKIPANLLKVSVPSIDVTLSSMSDEEIQKYNYLYDTAGEEEARKYLELLKPKLNANRREAMTDAGEMWAKKMPGLATLAATTGGQVIESVAGAISVVRYLFGQETIKNDPLFDIVALDNTMKATVSEGMSDPVKFGYNALAAILEQGTRFLFGGWAGSGIMAGRVLAGKTEDVIQRGGSMQDALLLGGISAGLEFVFNKMDFGRFMKLKNTFGKDGIKSVFKGAVLGGMVKSGISEGAEGGLQFIADGAADIAVMGPKSEWLTLHNYYMNENGGDSDAAWESVANDFGQGLAYDALMEGSVGVFFGGVSTVSRQANMSMNTKAADTTFQKDNFTETDAFQLAAQAQNSNAKPDVMKQYQDKVLSTLKIDPKTVETLTQSLGLKKGAGLFDALRKMTDLKVNPSRVAQSILKNKSDIQTVLDFARFNILKNTILPQTQNPEADAMVSRALLTATNLTFEERANNVQQSLDTMIGDMAELSAQMGKALEGTPTVNFTHTLRRWGQKGLIYVNSLIEAGQKDLAYRLQSLPSDSVAVIMAENNMEKLNVSQSDINAQLAAWELDWKRPEVIQNAEVRAEEQMVEVRVEEIMAETDLSTQDNVVVSTQEQAVQAEQAAAEAEESVAEAETAVEQATAQANENPTPEQVKLAEDAIAEAEKTKEAAKKAKKEADNARRAAKKAEKARLDAENKARAEAEAQARKELEQRKQEEAKLRQQAEQDYLALERDAIENEPSLTKQETPQQAPVVKAETADIESLADEYVKTQGADATPEEQAVARQKFIDKINARLSGKEPVFSEKSQQFMQKVEKKFGIKFVSDPNVKGAEEAYYDPTTNTIHLNANATQGDALAGVAMHELTHAAQKSGWYKQLSDTVVGILYKDEGSLERDIQAKIDRYAQDGKTLTSEQALQEIVAQGIRNKVFTDEASINRLLDMDVSLGQKILDVLNRILASFKGDSQILTARNLLEKALKDRGAPGQAQYSLPDIDQTYLSVVESGDTETAQKMVDEAAKRLMPDSKVRDGSGELIKQYHGTDAKFNTFKYLPESVGKNGQAAGIGFYFSPNLGLAKDIVDGVKNGRIVSTYLNITNPVSDSNLTITKDDYSKLVEAYSQKDPNYLARYNGDIDAATQKVKFDPDLTWDLPVVNAFVNDTGNYALAFETVREVLGYDGAIVSRDSRGKMYIAWNADQIKSADPVTYDDTGAPVPLSQRFDTGTNDIRYSLSDDDMDAYIDNLISKYGAIPQGETPVNSAPVPQKTSQNENVRKYARTASESGVFTPEQQDEFKAQLVDGKFSYEPISDQSVLNKADNLFKRGGVDGLQQEWARAIGGDRIPSKAQMAVGERLLQEYAKANDTENTMKMVSELSEVLTRAGQTVQAARLLKRMTNAGQLYYLKRAINKINNDIKGDPIDLNPDLVNDLMKAKTDKERNDAIDALSKDAGKQIPPSWKTRLTAWRYFAMLGNPRTHIRNIIGNLAFMPAIKIKNIIGTGLEVFIKEKTKSASVSRDEYSEAYADAEAHISALMSGGKYNPTNIINMNAPSFGNSLLGRGLEKVTQANMNALEAEDAWFLKRHYANALAGYLKANKLNLDTADEQTLTKARQYAVDEAKKGTYRDASAVASWLNEMSKKGGIPGIIIEGIMPFKKTPVNILKRGIEYSPIGLVDSLTRGVKQLKDGKITPAQLKDGKITPAQFIDKVSSGLTGTMIAGLGYFLASLGAIKIGFKDDKEDEFKRLTGSQEFAVEIFDYSITLDWLVPSAMPLFVGATLFETSKEELTFDGALSALSKIMEPVFNLTMLDGVNRAIESASWSQESPLTEVAINSAMNLLGQFIPTLLGQVARTIDPTRRKNYTDKNSSVPASIQRMLNTAKNKLPWLSEQSEPYLDVWGQEERTDSPWLRAFENFLSPAYINELTPDAVETMLMEVYKETGDPSVLPGTASKYFEVNNEIINLTGPEYTRFSKVRGQAMYEAMEGLMNRESFQELEPRLKAKTLAKAIDYANQAGKLDINPNYNADSLTITAMKGDPATAIIENIVNADKDAKRSGYKIDAIKAITAGDVESASATYGALTLWYQDKYPDDSDKEIRDRVKNYLNDDKIKEQYRAAYADGDDDLMFLIEDTLAEIGIRYKYNDWLKDRTK